MSKQSLHYLLAGIISIVLAGCSAGGGETGTGAQPSTVTVGVITGFGSVFVNGIEFETDVSTITLDDKQSTESDLKIGMVVTLTGDVDVGGIKGNALSISFNDNVEGMVLENNVTTNNQLIILGQTVIIDNFDTVFESAVADVQSIEQIQVNNIVEVSGYTSGDGIIYATRIEVKQPSRAFDREIELEGLVSEVTETTFKIGSMTIGYNISQLEDFNDSVLQNEDFVEVKSINDLDMNNQLIASKIKLKVQHKAVRTVRNFVDDNEIELEGVITGINSDTEFFLNGQLIIYNDETRFKNSSRLAIGKKAKIEGTVNELHQIVASRIVIRPSDKAKLESLITEINSDTRTIKVSGEDKEISITSSTTVRDERDERHFFSFNNLVVGDHVEVSYYQDDETGFLVAIKLELQKDEVDNENTGGDDDGKPHGGNGEPGSGNAKGEDNGREWEIKTTITEFDPLMNTIVMRNRIIDISNIIDFAGESAVGKLAEAKGVITEGVWVAVELEVEFEDDD